MIIGISGRIGSGKDTVGKIIQILAQGVSDDSIIFNHCVNAEIKGLNWEIKKFADKLKDIVCILTGCTREQLEDQDFKKKELSSEWWYWKLARNGVYKPILYPYLNYNKQKSEDLILVKPTYRSLLQLLGTDCGRNIIHPNIWINSLFSDYKLLNEKDFLLAGRQIGKSIYPESKYPNWIITDVRFHNEADAIIDRNGINIRVNRKSCESANLLHESETALDDAKFNYTIDNNGTIEELIEKVKNILINEKII